MYIDNISPSMLINFSLEEGGVVTECSIKTHEAVETLDFEFYGSTVINKIIMKVSMYVVYHTTTLLIVCSKCLHTT